MFSSECTFQYKGKVYSFSSLGREPLDILATLPLIDAGKVPYSCTVEEFRSYGSSK